MHGQLSLASRLSPFVDVEPKVFGKGCVEAKGIRSSMEHDSR